MGWLKKLLLGDDGPATTPDNTVLPKSVAAWEEGDDPVRRELDPVQTPADQPPAAPNPYRTAAGSKVIPKVEIVRIEPHLSSDEMHLEIWAHIRNHSGMEVEVRNINVLRQHNDLGRFLKPGEEHEVRVYSGEVPRNDAEHKVEVQFKITGNMDYFQADHQIKYHYERDEHGERYIPEEFRLIEPIRDI